MTLTHLSKSSICSTSSVVDSQNECASSSLMTDCHHTPLTPPVTRCMSQKQALPNVLPIMAPPSTLYPSRVSDQGQHLAEDECWDREMRPVSGSQPVTGTTTAFGPSCSASTQPQRWASTRPVPTAPSCVPFVSGDERYMVPTSYGGVSPTLLCQSEVNVGLDMSGSA